MICQIFEYSQGRVSVGSICQYKAGRTRLIPSIGGYRTDARPGELVKMVSLHLNEPTESLWEFWGIAIPLDNLETRFVPEMGLVICEGKSYLLEAGIPREISGTWLLWGVVTIGNRKEGILTVL